MGAYIKKYEVVCCMYALQYVLLVCWWWIVAGNLFFADIWASQLKVTCLKLNKVQVSLWQKLIS